MYVLDTFYYKTPHKICLENVKINGLITYVTYNENV